MRSTVRTWVFALLVATLVLSMSGVALAASYYDQLQPYVDQYHDNIGQIPKMARWPFANERINLTVVGAESTEVIGVVTSRGDVRITSFTAGELESPTLKVTVDAAALDAVLAAPTKEGALELVRSAKIQGVGLLRSIKAAIFRLAVRFI